MPFSTSDYVFHVLLPQTNVQMLEPRSIRLPFFFYSLLLVMDPFLVCYSLCPLRHGSTFFFFFCNSGSGQYCLLDCSLLRFYTFSIPSLYPLLFLVSCLNSPIPLRVPRGVGMPVNAYI